MSADVTVDRGRRGKQRGQSLLLGLTSAAMLAVALTIAPLALAAAGLWFAWRFASYATARVVDADIVDWQHQRDGDHPTASVAFARLHFTDHIGVERLVTSTIGIPTDLAVSGLDPLPEGPIRMRYRAWPFLALEDDRAVWFAGPVILLGTAILGTMLKVLFRFSPLAWIMGT